MSDGDRPNLLYILSDQHNASVLGCSGDRVVSTPNLDSLAESGVAFESAYCTSPLCVPSRMSILTGQHPHQIQVWTNEHMLDSSVPTFAHSMGAAGYQPILVGRMHAVGPDQQHGYAERYVGDLSADYVGVGSPRPDRGVLQQTSGPQRTSLKLSGSGQSGYEVYDEYVTIEAINKLNRIGVQKRSGQSTEPFCLSVGYVLPHAPFVARSEAYERFAGKVGVPKHSEPFSEDFHPFIQYWRSKSGIEEVTEEEIERSRTAYWALVSSLDAMIGRVLAALEENGLAENTMVVYMSDHGESVGEHGLWWKHTFYEDSVRVPVIISWPGRIPSQPNSTMVVNTIDAVATMIDALGAKQMPHSAGRSFLEHIQHPESSPDWIDEAYSESCTYDGWYMRMVRQGDWKLNYYHGHNPQLFHLAEDPHELEDRAHDSAVADVRRQLEDLVLRDWDPDTVRSQMESKQKDLEMIAGWVEAVRPAEQIPFELGPGPDEYWLDDAL